jgi:hypothetical protein
MTRTPGSLQYFPNGENAIDSFKRALGEKPGSERIRTLRDLMNRFSTTEVDNFNIFTTKDGVSFPYTSINIKEFVKKVYRAYSGKKLLKLKPNSNSKEKYFVFTSSPLPQNGHPFTFVEKAMQLTIEKLLDMIKDVEEGREPQDFEVITLGFPTNSRWGQITNEYAEKMKADAFGTLGETYFDLIKFYQFDFHTKCTFYGFSMGGNIAIETAKRAIEKGTLDPNNLKILIDSPVVPKKELSKIGITVLFVLGAVIELWRPISEIPATIKQLMPRYENKLLDEVDKILRNRHNNPIKAFVTTPEQTNIKKKSLDSLVIQLGKGLKIDPGLPEVTLRRGIYDPISTSKEWRKEIKKSKMGLRSIGNIREYPVRAGHLIPFFDKEEMQRWAKSIDSLLIIS